MQLNAYSVLDADKSGPLPFHILDFLPCLWDFLSALPTMDQGSSKPRVAWRIQKTTAFLNSWGGRRGRRVVFTWLFHSLLGSENLQLSVGLSMALAGLYHDTLQHTVSEKKNSKITFLDFFYRVLHHNVLHEINIWIQNLLGKSWVTHHWPSLQTLKTDCKVFIFPRIYSSEENNLSQALLQICTEQYTTWIYDYWKDCFMCPWSKRHTYGPTTIPRKDISCDD